jgi:hypothetical protein
MMRVKKHGGKAREKGAAVVELALLAPFYFLLVLGIVELGIMFWVDLTMQFAVREGARYAVTGQNNLDPNASNQQRYLAIIQAIRDNSIGLFDQVHPVIATSINGGPLQTYGDPGQYNSGMFGGPGDIVMLQLNCYWPLLIPLAAPYFSGGNYNFSVAATMRNEAYQ